MKSLIIALTVIVTISAANAGIVLENLNLIKAGRDLSLTEYPSLAAALNYGVKCENAQILTYDHYKEGENTAVFYDKFGKGYVKYICSAKISGGLSMALEGLNEWHKEKENFRRANGMD